MSIIRVAHVITRLELGGAQGNTLYTVSHLDRSRFEAHLVCGPGGLLDAEARELPPESLHFCDSLVREIRPLQDWKAYRQLIAVFREIKPDIVHTHSSKAGILGRFAAAAAGVRIIVHTYHGFGFHRFQNPLVFRFYVAVEKAACKRSHHLIFVSRENWQWAEKLGFTRTCPASLIRSGIPVQRILEVQRIDALRRELQVPLDSKLIGMIACLKPQKDPLTYVRAARIVLERLPDAHFILVGDGDLRAQVLREAAVLPEGHFHFLGWRRDVFQILRDLDLLVLTSLWEGLPRVIPEAIVAGVPVVASDIDGNREILQESRYGILAQPQQPSDFASRILEALQKGKVPADAAAMIRNEFDIDAMIGKQEELYTRLVEGH